MYEVVARSVHQISKTKGREEAPADNDPQVQPSSVEPCIAADVEANAEVWRQNAVPLLETTQSMMVGP